MIKPQQEHTDTFAINNNKIFVYIRMEIEKEIEYKSTIMEVGNIIKNQERVIEQLMFDMLNIKTDIEEVDEVAWVDRTKLNYFYILYLYYYYLLFIIYYLLYILESKKK